MNILHFGSNYLPNNGGNVVRMRMMLENNTYCNKDNVYILTTAKNDSIFSDEEYYKETGIKIFRIEKINDANRIIRDIVYNNKIDVVVTHIIPATIIACRKLPNNIKIVAEIHSLIQSSKFKMIGKNMLHRFLLNKKVRKYFVLSNGAKNYLIKNYKVKECDIIFLPNGYEPTNVELRPGNNDYFTFGYVGTFYSWQGIDMIFNNVNRILKIDEKIRVYLVGAGDKYKELKELSNIPEYRGRLIVTGMVSKDKVSTHLEQMDLILIPRPSTLETETAIPLKIFESTSSGKPVIISNVYGLTEVLDSDSAFVFDPNDEDGLFNACKEAFLNRGQCEDKFNNAVTVLSKWPRWSDMHKQQHDILSNLIMRKLG